MKAYNVPLLLLLALGLTSCMMDPIVDDMFGWIPGYQSSSSSSGTSQTQTSTEENTPTQTTTNSTDMDKFCSNIPNSHAQGGQCVCNDGFVSEMGRCVLGSGTPQVRECTFDQDCSPSGADKAVCEGTQYSLRYRCDLRSYTCIPRKGVYAEKVDCKAEFGQNYVCSSGMCVFQGTR